MISSLLGIMAVVGALELVVAVGEAILVAVILRWVRPRVRGGELRHSCDRDGG